MSNQDACDHCANCDEALSEEDDAECGWNGFCSDECQEMWIDGGNKIEGDE